MTVTSPGYPTTRLVLRTSMAVSERLAPEVVTLIQAMAKDNVLWGAERIGGELLKLCIRVILSERRLHRVLRQYVEIYFNRARPHQGLFQRITARAASRSVSEVGRNVVGLWNLGGLHHHYQRAA